MLATRAHSPESGSIIQRGPPGELGSELRPNFAASWEMSSGWVRSPSLIPGPVIAASNWLERGLSGLGGARWVSSMGTTSMVWGPADT